MTNYSKNSSNDEEAPTTTSYPFGSRYWRWQVRCSTNTNQLNGSPVHTLLLCRHGDSIWNGGQLGTQETFTGWTDVPLSQKGIKEASNTGKEVSSYS